MTRSLLRGVVAFIGTAFAAVSVLVFLPPVVADLRTGSAVLFTASRYQGVTWSRTYEFRDDPLYYGLSVLEDLTGVVGIGGMGLLLLSVAARSVRDPAAANVNDRAKVLGTAWAMLCTVCLLLHWLLALFPFLLKDGLLS